MNATLAATLVDVLECAHTALVVVCPGSRSTPLVLALARSGLSVRVAHDERSAAFIALGAARASERPAAVLTTSGSAIGHLYPAVLEAEAERLPLVLLTADRPAALIGSAANQTLDQRNAYGRHVGHAFDLDAVDRSVRARLDEAFAGLRGPLHINARFAKPLEGAPAAPVGPRSRVRAPVVAPDLTPARALLANARRGLLVVGRLTAQDDIDAARDIAETLAWPVVTSALSGLRCRTLRAPVLDDVDGALGSARVKEALRPDLVLHLGGPTVSARLSAHLADVPHVLVGGRPADDPPATVLPGAVSSYAPLITGAGAGPSALLPLAERIAGVTPAVPRPDDAQAAVHVVEQASAPVFVGNSGPIRDVDRFAPRRADGPRLFAHRGLSGIDGGLSATGGLAAVYGRAHALLGDVAYLHDAGAWSSLADLDLDVTVIDNRGGALFERLPIAEHADPAVFERYFLTPHAVDLAAVARAYGRTVRVVHVDRAAAHAARQRYDHELVRALDDALARRVA